jgi:hypothetical protein
MQAISIKWVTSVNDVPVSLFESCFRKDVEGRWWYETLEKSGLEDQFKFAYAIIYKGDKPVGIAPTFQMDVPMELVAPKQIVEMIKLLPVLGKMCPFLVTQKTLFIGSPCADEGTVGLIPLANLSEVAPALQASAEARARELSLQMVVWKDFSEADAIQLDDFRESHQLFRCVSYPGTLLTIPRDGLEGYYRQLKHSRRHNLKKKLTRSKQTFELGTEVLSSPSSQDLDAVFSLFWQTYEKGKTKFERLNRKFFELIAKVDASRFVLLRKPSGEIVAFMLCFDLGDKIINKFIGLDYRMPAKSYLYFRLWEAALEWVVSTGARQFQSGQTGYRAKIDVGNTLVPLTNFGKHRHPLSHKLYAGISRTISWRSLDRDLEDYLRSHPEDDVSFPRSHRRSVAS